MHRIMMTQRDVKGAPEQWPENTRSVHEEMLSAAIYFVKCATSQVAVSCA